MQNKVALQKIKYDTEKLLLQAMFNTMGVAQTEQTLQIMQNTNKPFLSGHQNQHWRKAKPLSQPKELE